jgi:hypothetical protein
MAIPTTRKFWKAAIGPDEPASAIRRLRATSSICEAIASGMMAINFLFSGC